MSCRRLNHEKYSTAIAQRVRIASILYEEGFRTLWRAMDGLRWSSISSMGWWWKTIVPHLIVVTTLPWSVLGLEMELEGHQGTKLKSRQNELFHLVMARTYEIGVN